MAALPLIVRRTSIKWFSVNGIECWHEYSVQIFSHANVLIIMHSFQRLLCIHWEMWVVGSCAVRWILSEIMARICNDLYNVSICCSTSAVNKSQKVWDYNRRRQKPSLFFFLYFVLWNHICLYIRFEFICIMICKLWICFAFVKSQCIFVLHLNNVPVEFM